MIFMMKDKFRKKSGPKEQNYKSPVNTNEYKYVKI